MAVSVFFGAKLWQKLPLDAGDQVVPANGGKSDTLPSRKGSPGLPAGASDGLKWADLESSSYEIYLRRLRDFGCPEKTIHDIIIANLNETWRIEIREVISSAATIPWDPANPTRNQDSFNQLMELKEKLADLQAERNEWVLSLLGEAGVSSLRQRQASVTPIYTGMQFLDEQRRQVIAMEMADFEELAAMVAQLALAAPAGVRQSINAAIDSSRIFQLLDILSDGEVLEFQLRYSPQSDLLQSMAPEFEWTAQEFRDAFTALYQSGTTDQFTTGDVLTIVEGTLPAERFEEFARYADPVYREYAESLQGILLREGVSEVDLAKQLTSLEKVAMNQIQAVESRDDMNDQLKAAVIAEITSELQSTVSKVVADNSVTDDDTEKPGRTITDTGAEAPASGESDGGVPSAESIVTTYGILAEAIAANALNQDLPAVSSERTRESLLWMKSQIDQMLESSGDSTAPDSNPSPPLPPSMRP
jgi:hypothetical protein